MEIDSGGGLLLITLGMVLMVGPLLKGYCLRLGIPVSVSLATSIAAPILLRRLLTSESASHAP